MNIIDLYKQLFGRKGLAEGNPIDMAEHGRVGGVSTGQPFKHTVLIDKDGGHYLEVNENGSINTTVTNPTADPETGLATSAKQDDIIDELQTLNSLIPSSYDYLSVAYPDTTTETYTFKTGGDEGTTVSTITLTYTDATKDNLSTMEAS